jgi:putative oxidoreductase
VSTTTFSRFQDGAHNLFRVAAGLLFWQHGAQKLFGWFGGTQVETLVSQMGVAGVLEFFGGILILIGLFTRPVAFVLAGEMAVAYVIAHVPQGFMPIQNGGELALLYCAGFLVLMTMGPGSLSVDAMRQGGEQPAVGGAGSAGSPGGTGGAGGVGGGGGPSGA